MKGIIFGNLHSYYEWGLILKEKEIKPPVPKINQIEIEGGDGVIDLSEFFGDVKYNNRSLSFTFAKMNIIPDGFLALYSVVQNAIHGKKMKVILDDDPNNYYFGRVTLNEWKSNKNLGEIVVEVDAEPYKYKVEETVVSQEVTGTATIILTNSRRRVSPIITIDAEMGIAFDTYSGTFSAGTFKIPELVLSEGENIVTVTGTGNITFRYHEGGL
jgi:phage-related protein